MFLENQTPPGGNDTTLSARLSTYPYTNTRIKKNGKIFNIPPKFRLPATRRAAHENDQPSGRGILKTGPQETGQVIGMLCGIVII